MPITSERRTDEKAPHSRAGMKGRPPVQRRRATRAPVPKKADWPTLICPVYPPSRFQLWEMVTYRNRLHTMVR